MSAAHSKRRSNQGRRGNKTKPSSKTLADFRRVIALAFAVALGARLLYVLAFYRSPFFTDPIVDGQWHNEWAWDWARGVWSMEGRAFFRAPLYPFWLSLLYRIFGHDLLAVRLVQAFLGAGTAAALAGAGFRIGGKSVGLWAGLIAALYGPLIFFDGELLIPNLLVFLLSWSLFFCAGPPSRHALILSGLALGLAAIARPNALVVLPALLGYLWVRLRPEGGRRRVVRLCVVGLLVLLAPAWVTFVNYRAEGAFVPIASQGGLNFYGGNHAGADGRSIRVPELEGRFSWRDMVPATRLEAEKSAGRPLDSTEVSSFWFRRGLVWIGDNSGEAATLTAKKVYYLLNGFETSNNRDPYFLRPWPLVPLLWTSPILAFPWGLLLPLCVAGAVVGWRDARLRAASGFLSAWLVLYGMSLVPFFICARFRMGMVPALILLAALAATNWRKAIRGWPVIIFLAALFVANTDFFDARVTNTRQEAVKLAAVLVDAGRIDEAHGVLEEARQGSPDDPLVLYLLANVHRLQGRHEEAVALLKRLARTKLEDPMLLSRIGDDLYDLGQYREAASMFREALALRPDNAQLWHRLGDALKAAGDGDEAEEAYRKARVNAPPD